MAERKKGKGSRRSRHEWQTLLAKLDDSGLGVDAFCRREGISAASLYRWRNLLSDGGEAAVSVSHRAAAFVDPRFSISPIFQWKPLEQVIDCYGIQVAIVGR